MRPPETLSTTPTTPSIAIIGAGPAGLTLATALAERDLEVALVSPVWPVPWPNNYGLWADELERAESGSGWGLSDCVLRRWDEVAFWGKREGRVLERAYVLLDNSAVLARLQARFLEAGGRVIVGLAKEARHDAASSRVVLEDAPDIIADLVIDATGHAPALGHRDRSSRPGIQVAYGLRGTLAASSAPLEEMRLMDWRSASGRVTLSPAALSPAKGGAG